MDDILKKMESRQKAEQERQVQQQLLQQQQQRQQQELQPQKAQAHGSKPAPVSLHSEMEAFKQRVTRHLRTLMQREDLKWTKYEPMEHRFRIVVASVADEYGLISLEFGEEEIDRYIIVYKPEFAPDEEEIARMTLKETMKLEDAQIEKIISQPAAVVVDEAAEAQKKPRRKKVEDVEDEPVGELHAVGTVKRVRRDAANAIEEFRLKKKLQQSSSAAAAPAGAGAKGDGEIDSLFFGREDEDGEEKNT